MLKPSELFDLRHTSYKEVFHNIDYAWEAIPHVASYIKTYINPVNNGKMIGEPHIEGMVQIGEGTVIEPNVVIKGPTIIGRNCEIRQGAYIRGNALIGDNCVVGNSTEVKNSVLLNDVQIPHFNYVGDSILGYKAHLGAGVVLSNAKTPMSEIKVITLEKTYKTGLKKFGAIIGDKTEIGCNTVLNPGTVIGSGCLIYPGTVFRGVVANNSIVKSRQEQEIVIKLKK